MTPSSASSPPSVVDLLGAISTAAWAAATLATGRPHATPDLRPFAAAWASIAVHLLSRPGALRGDPLLLVLDLLSGAAASAFLLYGASSWSSELRTRGERGVMAVAAFGASCAVQAIVTVVTGPSGAELSTFRTLRLFAVTLLAFHLTKQARRGSSISARTLSWAFGALALLSAISLGQTSLRPSPSPALTVLVDSVAMVGWIALALSMGACVAGDAVLLEVADRLRSTMPPGALTARVGGDEFAAVWLGVSDSAEALRLAEELSSCLAQPMHVRGQEVVISATAGVSLFPADAVDAATLLDHAHAAAYRTKERGPGRAQLYRAEMTGRSRRELSMELRLRRALSLNEIWVYYQPQVSLQTGLIEGFEALVRWLHPSEGLLAAGAFVDLAESTGLMIPIGRFVLSRACHDAQEARVQSGVDFTVAVNLSAQQLLDPRIIDDVSRALHESGLPAEALELEVTETAAMSDIAQARRTLEHLREIGVRIALDDFGTGHSALSYLKELPIDRLKVDKCFVRDLASDAKDRFLLRAVIALGRARGLAVTAEGVEDPAQLRFLAAAGCHSVQGFLVGTARPSLELARLAGQAPEGVSMQLPRRKKARLSLVPRQA